MAAFSPRPDRVALLFVGLGLVAVAAAATVREISPEWAKARADVRRRLAEKVGEEKARETVPDGIQQIWIPEIGRVDRCVTCHAGMEAGDAAATLPHPARSHPLPALIAKHPFDRFGCTLCHGGQGWATTKEAAHGNVDFWDEPLLSTARARRYGLSAAELMETACNACHRHEAEVAGMPRIKEAKAIFQSKRCLSCHTVDGKGGKTGPELTAIGDKPAVRFHFPTPWTKPRTALAWNIQHLLDPPSTSPGTAMEIKGGLSEREATSLALLVRSWTSRSLPPAWLPKAK